MPRTPTEQARIGEEPVRISLRLPHELHRLIDAKARINGRSLNHEIMIALEDHTRDLKPGRAGQGG